MARYSESELETIKSRLALNDVIGSYVRLVRSSNGDYKACCPFHNEKTPSFIVHNDKGFYHCFGCGKSGDMFSFVSEIEKVSYKEAIEILANKAGVELKKLSAQEVEEQKTSLAIKDLYNRISNTFHQILLTHPQAEKARLYLSKRGVSTEFCNKFMLGYAPSDPKWLYGFLKKNNFSDELLYKSGLIYKEYSNSAFFTDRLLFPVRDKTGNTIAFSGRDLSGRDNVAKYKNSSASFLYSKKDSLFGFYESLPEIKKRSEIILCEGNFDVMALHQAGLSYACAPLGTSFTEEQAVLIKRYCTKVSLLFDSDNAGQNATKKAILLCQKYGLECNVINNLPNAKDASQMLEEQGGSALVQACSDTKSAFDCLVHLALKMYDIRQPKGRTSVFKEVLPYLDATSSEIERQGYIRLLSDVLKIKEEQILEDYKKQRSKISDTVVEKVPQKVNYNPLKLSLDLNVMLLIFNNRNFFDFFRREVRINNLEDKDAQMLYSVLENASREDIKTNEVLLQMIDNEELRNFVASSMAEGLYNPENPKVAVNSAITQIKLQRLLESRDSILSLINSSEIQAVDVIQYKNMLEAKVDLDKKIEELKKNSEVTDN